MITSKQVRDQGRRLCALLDQLLALPAGVRGTFSRIYTRCGKPTCWCAREPQGHPHTRLTWSENGTLITRKVPGDQIQEVLRLTANYRRFRALRRQLRELQGEIDRRLDRYEQDVTVRARRALKFLPPPPKMGSNGAERGRKQAAGRNAKA
jgi:hypothetical protein